MAEYYLGTIDILKEHIEGDPEVKKMVQDYFYSPDGRLYDDGNWVEDSLIAYFRDDNARYGYFYELEELLQKKRIPYNRWSDSYDYDSTQIYYRPDISDEPIYANGRSGEREYTESFLKGLADGIDDLAELGKKFKEFLDNIKKIKPLEAYLEENKKC